MKSLLSLPSTNRFLIYGGRKEILKLTVGTTPLSFLTQKLLLLNHTLHLWPAALADTLLLSVEQAADFPAGGGPTEITPPPHPTPHLGPGTAARWGTKAPG